MRTENGCHSEETVLQEYFVVFFVSVCLHGFVAVLHEIGFLVEILALVTSQSVEVCAKQRKFILNLPEWNLLLSCHSHCSGAYSLARTTTTGKSPEDVTPSGLARKMCSVLNRWSSLEEERNSWKFVVRCSRGPPNFKTGHFTTLIGRERLWNAQKWETHVQSVQNNFFLVHMQICVVLVTVHVVVAFATFWQRDDSEISSLKWFLLVLCR